MKGSWLISFILDFTVTSLRVSHLSDFFYSQDIIWFRDFSRKKKIHLPMQERLRFNLCIGKIPWWKQWQPTVVFLPGKFPGQRVLLGYSPWGQTQSKELGTTEWLSPYAHTNLAHTRSFSKYLLKKMIKMQGLRPFRCLVNQSRMNKTEQNIQGLPAVWCSWKTLGTRRHCKKEITASGYQTTRGLLELPGRARIPSSRQVQSWQ